MENSSREQASHQHSPNLDTMGWWIVQNNPSSDPPDFVFTRCEVSAEVDDVWASHELYVKYPVGTLITSSVVYESDEGQGPDTYEVVSYAEYEHAVGIQLEGGYLAVKWVDGPSNFADDPYDGFYEHHIDGIRFSSTSHVRDLLLTRDLLLMPWVSAPTEVDTGLVHKPQPRYGWRG